MKVMVSDSLEPPFLQFASMDRTSSFRCTQHRGSPGTLCARTTGVRATGGRPARTWATGEFLAPCPPR